MSVFVSTRGICNGCDLHPVFNEYGSPSYPGFRTDFENGTTIYLLSDMVGVFISNYAKQIQKSFVLVIGETDLSMPDDYKNIDILLQSPRVLAIYSQNNVCLNHSKLRHLPIGLDYHTLSYRRGMHDWNNLPTPISMEAQEHSLMKIREENGSYRFDFKVCTNFQNCILPPEKRVRIRSNIYRILKDKNFIVWLPKQTREEFWKNTKDYSCVISPPGNGLDCHRTWEILALNRIPIVEKTPINKVYDGLPIIEVDDWNNLTEDFIRKELQTIEKNMTNKKYNLEKLTLAYWVKEINSYKMT